MRVGISHIVQVVSMLDVMISFGESVFQSREVKGAVCSGVFELESRARGSNFCTGASRVFALDERLILLVTGGPWAGGRDHNRR